MKILLVITFVALTICAAQPDLNSAALEIVRTELEFSRTAILHGTKSAFLEFLSDDCVMFNPYPVNGKELYRNRPANSANLSWYPTFVEVAASGDFGISTGPWEFRKTKNDSPVAYGHFFSVWKKQADGSWKVTFDNGISYSKANKRNETEHIVTLNSPKLKKTDGEHTRAELEEAEHQFIQSVKENGMIDSYSTFASNTMRVYRNGNFPSQQKSEAIDLLKKQESQKDYSPIVTQVASSGDLGFTYGFSVDAKNDSSSYIRVWRKEKEWKIAVDMFDPFKKK